MAMTAVQPGASSISGQQELLQDLLPGSKIEPPLKWVTPEMVCVRYVHKVNHRGKKDKRVVAITPTTFFLVHVVGEVRRYVKMAQVEGIVLGKTAKGVQQLWVRCTEPEHDMLLLFTLDIRNDTSEEPRQFVEKLRKIKEIRGEYFPVGDSSEDLFPRARLIKYPNYVPPKKRMDRCLASGFGRLNKLVQEELGGGGGLEPTEQDAVYEMGRMAAARGAARRHAAAAASLGPHAAPPGPKSWTGSARPPPLPPGFSPEAAGSMRAAPPIYYPPAPLNAVPEGGPLHVLPYDPQYVGHAPQSLPGGQASAPATLPAIGQAPHTGTFSQAPQAPHTGMFSQAPHTGTFSQAPHTGTFSQAPHTGTFSQAPQAAPPAMSGAAAVLVSPERPPSGLAEPYEHPDLRPPRLTADDGIDPATGARYFSAHDIDTVERERWDRRRAATDRAGAPRPEDLGTVSGLRSPYHSSAQRARNHTSL